MLVEKHENGSISIDAQNYEDCIDIVHISPERHQDNNAILNTIEEAEFRSALGKIMRLVRLARPDLAFQSSKVAQKFDDETILEEDGEFENTRLSNEDVNTKVNPTKFECTRDDSSKVKEHSHMPGFKPNLKEVKKINAHKQKNHVQSIRISK